MIESYEAENRRAEVDGAKVAFFKLSGSIRRSKHGFWFDECKDTNTARRKAMKWMRQGKLN